MMLAPLSPYAISKLAAEKYCSISIKVYGLETVALRYFKVFGPRQDPTSQYSAVIPKFITAMLNNRKPVIYGDGEQSRDFTFVTTVVNGNILGATTPVIAGIAVNCACHGQITLNFLVKKINDILGKNIQPEYANPKPGDIKHSEAGLLLSCLAIVGLLKGVEHLLRSVVYAKGWVKIIFISKIIETIVSLPMMYYGIGLWGVMGLLYAYICASAISFVFTLWFAQKATQDNTIFFRSMAHSFIAALLMIGVVLFSKQVHFSHIYLNFMLQIVTGGIAYLILRIYFLTEEHKKMMSRYPVFNYFFNVKTG